MMEQFFGEILLPEFCRGHPDTPKWTNQMWMDCLQRGSDKNKIQYYLDSNGYLLCMRAIQGHSGGNKVDPSLQDTVEIPYDWMGYIYHVGSSHDCMMTGLVQHLRAAILDTWREKVAADLCGREGFRGGPLLDFHGSLQLLNSSHVRERDKALLRSVLVGGVWNGFSSW